MIYKTLTVVMIVLMNGCSPSENDQIVSEEKNSQEELLRASEEDAPYAYIEELHYMHLITEYGEDHELIPVYREKFEGIAAGVKPGSGCPKPAPCDLIGNCKAFLYDTLKGLMNFSEMEDVTIGMFHHNSEPMNEISSVQVVKCPGKKSLLYDFAQPLEGDGYFEIGFASEFTQGEMVEFKLPFYQE